MYQTAHLVSFLAAAGLTVASLALPGSLAAQTNHHGAHTSTAPLLDKLGTYHHPISTKNPQAQRYFDQGLLLAYGFNHAEADRSFKEAAKLDPNCAMCHWGSAYVLGPNINAPMDPKAVPEAWKAIGKAVALSRYASPKEQAYIRALQKRYSPTPLKDRERLDLAYAEAMRKVAARYPKDPDAATLFAESLMDTTPWDYWQPNGEPKPEAKEIMATLEAVLKRNPNHPGANHFYIHAVEKQRPELGVASADRLMTLAPGSGHLVHMASHIYIRVGRYHDAVVSNQRGAAADDAYLSACHAQGLYPLAYKPHNHHFLWFAALMTGQSELALQAANQTAQVDKTMRLVPELAGAFQHYSVIPLYTAVRFSNWEQILKAPAPEKDLRYSTGVWHYAQGRALLATGQLAQATEHLTQLQRLADDPQLKTVMIWGFNATTDILKIATEILSGEKAAAQGDYDRAIAHLETAVKLENALVYTEPADWYQPTRQALAQVLLRAGRPEKAEQVYREDLKIYPENGWSLFGLAQSLQAQGKTAQAGVVQQQFGKAWQYADVVLADTSEKPRSSASTGKSAP